MNDRSFRSIASNPSDSEENRSALAADQTSTSRRRAMTAALTFDGARRPSRDVSRRNRFVRDSSSRIPRLRKEGATLDSRFAFIYHTHDTHDTHANGIRSLAQAINMAVVLCDDDRRPSCQFFVRPSVACDRK